MFIFEITQELRLVALTEWPLPIELQREIHPKDHVRLMRRCMNANEFLYQPGTDIEQRRFFALLVAEVFDAQST